MVACAGRPWLAALLLGLFVACATSRPAVEDAESPAPSNAAATSVTTVPTSASGAPIPEYTDPPSELVAAYMRSCDHRVRIDDDEYTGETFDECDFIEFDQNCAPDPSGCWNEGEGCKSRCKLPCKDCQRACAASCGECRSACATGDDNCVRHCAQLRASCRDGCMEAFGECTGPECSAVASACYETFDARKEETCPDCAAIGACLGSAYEHSDDATGWCKTKFPTANRECFDWCHDW